jgi:TorA maturation chaperone TorD
MDMEEIYRSRAEFYAFLSRMFVEEPPLKLAEDIASRKFPVIEVSSFNSDFAEGVHLIKKFMKSERDAKKIFNTLCEEYTRLFLGPSPVMFPYESRYVDGIMMGKSLIKVKEEYRCAGLEKVQGYHEPEDHIAVELGFMSRLCRNKTNEAFKIQKEFLDNHLLKWVPKFCDELYKKSENDFYKGIGKLTKGFIISEKDVV